MSTSSEKRGTVCVLLPAYNEAEALPPLLREIARVAEGMPEPVRVIVVDDGSTDGTADVARREASGVELDVVKHPQNRGLAAALISGIERALELCRDPNDILVGMDADDTHPPESIPDMAERIWAGQDVVIASRYQPGSQQVGVPAFRRFLSWGARMLFRVLLPIPGVRDYTCGFRAYRLEALRELWRRTDGNVITSQGFACTDELLVKLALITGKIGEVPFTLRYDRKPGESKLKLGLTIRAQLRVLFHLRRLRRQGLPN